MIQITLNQCAVQVMDAPNGDKLLTLHDQQSGIVVVVPLDERGVAMVVRALKGSHLTIAHKLPAGQL